MKAALINHYGNENSFSLELDVPEPAPTNNQVKIQVKSAGVNPLDYRIRNGELKFFIPSQFPMILGNDAAGIVTEVGCNVKSFQVGDRVFGLLDANEFPSRRGFSKPGCYAEFAVTREDTLAIIPDNIDFTEAAATPLAALTAYQTLHNKTTLSPGQSLLINGASGGVGTFAVQIAKAMGLKVTAVCSTKNSELLLSLGADNCIDYKTMQLENLSGRFDAIYDVVANQSYSNLKHLLNPNGCYLSNVATGSTIMSGIVNKILSPFGAHRRNFHAWVMSNGEDLKSIARLIEKKQITPIVSQVIPLENVSTAHKLIQSGHTTGKLVLGIEKSMP